MTPTQDQKGAAFRALHEGDPFVIPNPWDAGSAKILAVRKVTQDNQGKKTAGVDGVKDLNHKQRRTQAHTRTLGDKSPPVSPVLIK